MAIDLILAVLLAHAPNALEQQFERGWQIVEFKLEQRQMPPIVRQHERRAPIPAARMGVKERAPFDRLSVGGKDMRHHMFGPGVHPRIEVGSRAAQSALQGRSLPPAQAQTHGGRTQSPIVPSTAAAIPDVRSIPVTSPIPISRIWQSFSAARSCGQISTITAQETDGFRFVPKCQAVMAAMVCCSRGLDAS